MFKISTTFFYGNHSTLFGLYRFAHLQMSSKNKINILSKFGMINYCHRIKSVSKRVLKVNIDGVKVDMKKKDWNLQKVSSKSRFSQVIQRWNKSIFLLHITLPFLFASRIEYLAIQSLLENLKALDIMHSVIISKTICQDLQCVPFSLLSPGWWIARQLTLAPQHFYQNTYSEYTSFYYCDDSQ